MVLFFRLFEELRDKGVNLFVLSFFVVNFVFVIV